jgi:hypothetical protein
MDPVQQIIGPGSGRWWVRDDDGTLFVWCEGGHPQIQTAPIDEWVDRRNPHKQWTGTVDPRRITHALDALGLDGPEVDEALGVDEPTVDLWETGALVPTPADVRRLCTLTGMLLGWFYNPDPLLEMIGWACTRGPGGGCHRLGEPEPPAAPVQGALF